MNFRPAGLSSDEDDDYGGCYFSKEDFINKAEKKRQLAAEFLKARRDREESIENKIYQAVISDNLEIIKKEIADGFNVNSKIYGDWTALLLASAHSKWTIVQELIQQGANINDVKDFKTALMYACSSTPCATSQENILKTVKLLIESGVDKNAIDLKRKTAFMFACEQGIREVVEYMIPLYNLETTCNQGRTALYYAVDANKSEIVKLLIENGVNVNHIDLRKNNVKYYALCKGHYEVTDILKELETPCFPENVLEFTFDYINDFELAAMSGRPALKFHIPHLLVGMNCRRLISFFKNLDIDLFSFLSLSDEEILQLNIFTFDKKDLINGLHRFHVHRSSFNTLSQVQEMNLLTTFDLFVLFVNVTVNLILVESSLKYIRINFQQEDRTFFMENLANYYEQIFKRSKAIMELLCDPSISRFIQYDQLRLQTADLITKDRKFKKNVLKKKLFIFGITGLATVLFIRFWKLH